MPDRTDRIRAFLSANGWAQADISLLAGDASNRRYFRLRDGEERSVLMDAAPERGEDIRPFTRVATHLTELGLSAPKVLAADETLGLLLLEDLGDSLFARVLEEAPDLEMRLYSAATDLLCALHAEPVPARYATYDAALMTQLAALAFDWYLPGATGRQNADARRAFTHAFRPLLEDHAAKGDVLILRDYHAENLIWLPDREGIAGVGLLDFQDAMAGHRAYDLVSLLQDARRDVPASIEQAMLSRYVNRTGVEEHAFRAAYHVLGAQRNLRIIGVFARLCLRDGKASYIDLIPRVWALLQRDLEHPALAPVRPALKALPTPTSSLLARLKEQCATIPAPS